MERACIVAIAFITTASRVVFTTDIFLTASSSSSSVGRLLVSRVVPRLVRGGAPRSTIPVRALSAADSLSVSRARARARAEEEVLRVAPARAPRRAGAMAARQGQAAPGAPRSEEDLSAAFEGALGRHGERRP